MANEPREDARHHSATRKCGPQPREAPLHARQTVGTGCRRRGGGGREAGAPGAPGGSVRGDGAATHTAGRSERSAEADPRQPLRPSVPAGGRGNVCPHGPCAATAGPGSATEEETPHGHAGQPHAPRPEAALEQAGLQGGGQQGCLRLGWGRG